MGNLVISAVKYVAPSMKPPLTVIYFQSIILFICALIDFVSKAECALRCARDEFDLAEGSGLSLSQSHSV